MNEALGPHQSAWGPSSTIRAYESTDDDDDDDDDSGSSVDAERSSESGVMNDEGVEIT